MTKYLKNFIKQQYAVLKQEGLVEASFSTLAWIGSLLISVYILIVLAVPLSKTTHHKGHVFPRDHDGGRAIEVSIATRWYNSNHFAPYGNLYYRLSQPLADLISLDEKNFSPKETQEKAHHFSLKLISLFSLFSIGFFLGWILFGIDFLTPLYASLFTLLSLYVPMWATWVFRPHPEHLLNAMTAVSVYFFAKFLGQKENRKIFILSAFFWGLTMATKRSTSIFIPGILIMLLLPWKRGNLKNTITYISYMLFAYLLIGFPQNFGFYKHVKFLLYESSLHSLPDGESISLNLKLIWGQLIYLLPVVMISTIFSKKSEKIFSWRIVIFVFLSCIPILMRKMSFAGDHHTMALAVAFLMVGLIVSHHFFPWRITHRAFVFFLLVGLIKATGIAEVYKNQVEEQTYCFSEYDEIKRLMDNKISENNQLVKETLFPGAEAYEPYTLDRWGIHWENISPKVRFFGITQRNTEHFLPQIPKDNNGKTLEEYDKKNRFYHSVNGKSSVTSPTGMTYKKIFVSVKCDLQLWERVDSE